MRWRYDFVGVTQARKPGPKFAGQSQFLVPLFFGLLFFGLYPSLARGSGTSEVHAEMFSTDDQLSLSDKSLCLYINPFGTACLQMS